MKQLLSDRVRLGLAPEPLLKRSLLQVALFLWLPMAHVTSVGCCGDALAVRTARPASLLLGHIASSRALPCRRCKESTLVVTTIRTTFPYKNDAKAYHKTVVTLIKNLSQKMLKHRNC